MTKAERTAKRAAKALDNEIDEIYRKNCSGIQVNILDIPQIFDEGRKARAEGRDVKEAIVSFVQTIRKN